MKIIITFIFVLFLFSCASSQKVEASSCISQLFSTWYDSLLAQFSGVSWWITGTCVTSILDFSIKTNSDTFVSLTFLNNLYVKDGWIHDDTEGYDDIQWWGIAWIQAYKFSNIELYLARAESIFKEVQSVWTTECGGGVWWDRKKTYKNAITNELFLVLATELYLLTNQSLYQQWALKEWNWFNQSGIINNNFLINDGLDTQSCKNNGENEWTYNQGVVLGGLVNLYKITGDDNYILTASKIANATINHLSRNGILVENCESNGCSQDGARFKGIFMRYFSQLQEIVKDSFFSNFISANAQSISNNDRNNQFFGLKWTGPFDSQDASRQCSALDAFIANI